MEQSVFSKQMLFGRSQPSRNGLEVGGRDRPLLLEWDTVVEN